MRVFVLGGQRDPRVRLLSPLCGPWSPGSHGVLLLAHPLLCLGERNLYPGEEPGSAAASLSRDSGSVPGSAQGAHTPRLIKPLQHPHARGSGGYHPRTGEETGV